MEQNLPQGIETMQQAYDVVDTLSKETSGVIQKALRAQLAVIQLIQKPILVRTCIDTVFENLHQGIEEATNDSEIKLMRQQSALLVQSTLFFFQATILKNKKENKEEGKELFRIATQNVASFSVQISETVAKGMLIGGTASAASLALEVGIPLIKNYFENKKEIEKNLPEEKKEMFHKRFVNFVYGYFENSKEEEEYLKLLDSVFDKFERNKMLLGKSILLSELIMNNYQDIINFKLKTDIDFLIKKQKEIESIKNNIFRGWYLLIYPFILLALLITYIIDYFAKTTIIESYYIGYWLLFPIPIYIYKYFKNSMKKKKLLNEVNGMEIALNEKKASLIHKYESISKTLNPYS
ncbi:hypothetical protein [Flavobacterium sp.]|uniref:hypothetical protein n=1 Tax=Flavobacterium sp. TaxID=239 RepID=UPI002625E6E2|nr:hypothetical protein [Flavobacterium sp.]MDD2986100.1 hypothetical protein [Flavobacterium sp.]